MYLQSLATAFPPESFTQLETWEELSTSGALDGLNRRARKVLETVLKGDSGVDKRHFALAPRELFKLDAQGLNEAFEREAPDLASAALERACVQAGVEAAALDAVFVCTCTGYLCPGVSSHVGEKTGLREETVLHDVAGMGCAAAVPTLHMAHGYLAANPEALVATVAVEICSAAYYLNDDAGVLVSACLFGDGAAAALWRGEGKAGEWRASHFQSLHVPAQREKIRFVNAGGKLRNQLHRDVPEVAAGAVARLFARRDGEPDRIIAHTGGRDVIDAIERAIPEHRLDETRTALRLYGNLSSPSLLVALDERLRNHAGDRRLWLTGFGAGFSAHSCELSREHA